MHPRSLVQEELASSVLTCWANALRWDCTLGWQSWPTCSQGGCRAGCTHQGWGVPGAAEGRVLVRGCWPCPGAVGPQDLLLPADARLCPAGGGPEAGVHRWRGGVQGAVRVWRAPACLVQSAKGSMPQSRAPAKACGQPQVCSAGLRAAAGPACAFCWRLLVLRAGEGERRGDHPRPTPAEAGVSASGETDQNSSQLRPQLGMEVRPQTEVRLSLTVRLCSLSVFLK